MFGLLNSFYLLHLEVLNEIRLEDLVDSFFELLEHTIEIPWLSWKCLL